MSCWTQGGDQGSHNLIKKGKLHQRGTEDTLFLVYKCNNRYLVYALAELFQMKFRFTWISVLLKACVCNRRTREQLRHSYKKATFQEKKDCFWYVFTLQNRSCCVYRNARWFKAKATINASEHCSIWSSLDPVIQNPLPRQRQHGLGHCLPVKAWTINTAVKQFNFFFFTGVIANTVNTRVFLKKIKSCPSTACLRI